MSTSANRTVLLGEGETLPYDALVLATGAAAEPAFGDAHVFNWDDTSGADAIGGLLRDLEEGYSQRLTIVVPAGPGWPFPPTSWRCSSPATREAWA